jgi:hypothetical protein
LYHPDDICGDGGNICFSFAMRMVFVNVEVLRHRTVFVSAATV